MSTSFRPTGPTHLLSVSNVSSSVQVTNITQANAYRFHNGSAQEIFVTWATAAAPTAVAPTVGSPQNSIPIHANATVVLTLDPNAFIAAIAGAVGPFNLFITPGEAVL